MNGKQLAIVMRSLSKTATVAAICTSAGVTRQTIYKTLRALEGAKVARVCDWNRDSSGRAVEPVWGLGGEPSVPRKRFTGAQKQRNYRQRKKKGEMVMQSIVVAATAARACDAAVKSKITKA